MYMNDDSILAPEREPSDEKNRGRPRLNSEPGSLYFKLPASYARIINEYKIPGETNVEFVKRAIDFYSAHLDFKKNQLVDVSEPQMSLEDVARLIRLLSSSQ